MTSPAEKPARRKGHDVLRITVYYLATVLVGVLVWIRVLDNLEWLRPSGYGVLLLPVWGCFGVGVILAAIGGVAALAGRSAKWLWRWAIYSGVTGFVFAMLFFSVIFAWGCAAHK